MLIIEPGDPEAAGPSALLRASHGLMLSLFAREECHFLDISALKAPEIAFFVARDNDETLGTGALANRGDYGEIKSMFVTDHARGRGVAAALLRAIEDHARLQKLTLLRLETGDSLLAAQRLYTRHGFTPCDAFGTYPGAPTSVFMEKHLLPL